MARGPILKTREEIEIMRRPGRVVAECLQMIRGMIEPGVSTLELDQAVEKHILESGGKPLFKGYPAFSPGIQDFPGSICASINEEVVHGIPSATRLLREGDLVSIDIGVELDGFAGDAAWTFCVGEPTKKAAKLLEAGEGSLMAAIKAIRPGVPLSKVSRAVQEYAESRKFSVVKKFVGHGIGREMHEPPQVPNFVDRRQKLGSGVILKPGTVLAIEPMVNAGTDDVEVLSDGWTVVTVDRKPSVHFEHSVAVTEDGPLILTVLD